MKYVVPAVILLTVLIAAFKKISVYDSFVTGAKEAVKLTLSVLPYVISVFVMCEIFSASGLSGRLADLLEKPFSFFGIPKEVIELVLIRPISGSGSIVFAEKLFTEYGVDSYVARCAAVISGCSDTVFYIVAVYLTKSEEKKTYGAVPIALFSTLVGNVFACLICRVL